jgi:mannose-6-phosphate isomerase-like protein (cupin superfamily)
MLERIPALRQRATESNGVASDPLGQFPQPAIAITSRNQSGTGELHRDFADLFYILDGRATLLTGGAITGAEAIAPGQIRGLSVEGGIAQELRPGDVAHIPAGLPHQMLLAKDESVAYFVMKIQEAATTADSQ